MNQKMKTYAIGFNGNDEVDFEVPYESGLEPSVCELFVLFHTFLNESNIVLKSVEYIDEMEDEDD